MILWAAAAFAGTWDVAVEDRVEAEAFRPPSVQERARYADLVRMLARAAPSGHVPAGARDQAERLGFLVEVDGDVVTLREAPDARRGAGMVAIRLGPQPAEIVVQAPHPFHDLGTGRIVGGMFDGGRVRAVQLATAQRFVADSADVAHDPLSLFQAATDALVDTLVDPLVVQIHGFGGDTSDKDAVISAGSARLPPGTVDIVGVALREALRGEDIATGRHEWQLAGLDNAQSRLVADRARFVHLELSKPLRSRLRESEARQAALVTAFLTVALRGEAP